MWKLIWLINVFVNTRHYTPLDHIDIFAMAAGTTHTPGGHPVRFPPVRPYHRYAATFLGASMWYPHLPIPTLSFDASDKLQLQVLPDVPREKGRTCSVRPQAPLGTLRVSYTTSL